MVELDDIRQALYQWFVEHPNKLDEWESIGEKDAKNLIYRSLRNRALDYCSRWKAKSIGYDYTDVYYYKPELVEALLPNVLRGGLKLGSKQPNLGFTGRPSAPAEGGDILVLMLEIDSAYWKLSKEDKKLLFLRYAESFDFKEIANSLELFSEDTARMRHKRAIKRLVNKLGGYKPYPDRDLSDKEDETKEDSVEDSDDKADSSEWNNDRGDED